MKKALTALFAAVLLVACEPAAVKVTDVKLNQSSASVVEGETLTLKAIVSPTDAENKALAWTSSNSAVATVTDGVVTALKEGKTDITATSTDGSNVSATCAVTVTKKAIEVTAVQLTESDPVTLSKDATLQLSAVISPSDATDHNVKWNSDSPDVASVDANGLVTALKGGVAYITATVGGVTSEALMVTVLEPKPMFVVYPYCLLRTGGSITQIIYYGSISEYADRDDAIIERWESDNPAVASVDDKGKVTAVSAGQANVTATDATGSSISFQVCVEDRPDRQYDDYLPGIALVNCHDASHSTWKATNAEYALTEGYVEGTQCMGAKVRGYKIAEIFLPQRTDVSSIENPALFIRMYIDDPAKLTTVVRGDEPIVEIRSTEAVGSYEETNKRNFWRLQDLFTNMDGAKPSAKQTLVAGWNNIVLPFDQAPFQGGLDTKRITYFRIYQMHGESSYQEVEFRFDQIRVIDWTEFERCDNFAMWRDRPAQANQYSYYHDTEGQAEGTGCITCKDVLFSGSIHSYRLEMWPGLEYAFPAMYDEKDLALQLKFWVDDAEFFNKYINFDFEIAKGFVPDVNGLDVSFGGSDGLAWPEALKDGWNTITIPFADYEGFIRAPWDLRLNNYFRIVLTPQDWDESATGYHTYKLDDIRIVKK